MIENPLEHKNKLLGQHRSGEISLEELEKECAYWFMETFDTMHKRVLPTPPADYAEYQMLSYDRRQKIGIDFWHQRNIKEYLEIKEQIKNENQSRLIQLKEYKKHIPQEDFISIGKFNSKIEEFEY